MEQLPFQDVFPRMTTVVKPGAVGVAAVDHFTVTKSDELMTSLSYRPWLTTVQRGRYARLKVRGTIVMSDTRMERRSNLEAVREARGDVLIGGLGLGMVVIPILRKPDVRTVTVVEKEHDVVALIEPQVRRYVKKLSAKLRVVVGDVNAYRPDWKFDAAYFDIWPEVSEDNLPEIARLHQRFKGRLRRTGEQKPWIGSWMADYLRNERRRA